MLYMKLLQQFPHLPNVQDAQGWSLVNHMVAKGNAAVATIILESAPPNQGQLGLISAVPFTIRTHVTFTQENPDAADEGESTGLTMATRIKSVSPNLRSPTALALASNLRRASTIARPRKQSDEEDELESLGTQKSTKSFSQTVKRVAVELFTE
ncbi:WD_REPEATS_REGION domain-containing protein, partial [Haematococcus lacustris]